MNSLLVLVLEISLVYHPFLVNVREFHIISRHLAMDKYSHE